MGHVTEYGVLLLLYMNIAPMALTNGNGTLPCDLVHLLRLLELMQHYLQGASLHKCSSHNSILYASCHITTDALGINWYLVPRPVIKQSSPPCHT